MTKPRRDIQARAFDFAARVVMLCKAARQSESGLAPLTGQLLKSATSIGANLEEATAGQSKADFIAKCSVSLKEARETLYWLRLIGRCYSSAVGDIGSLTDEADQLVAILTTIVRNAKASNSRGAKS